VANLLYRALKQAREDLTDPLRALEALTRLALILEDRAEARQWVEQALQRNPMSASLAMLRDEVEGGPTPGAMDPSQEKAA
jgi:hypothetical protein